MWVAPWTGGGTGIFPTVRKGRSLEPFETTCDNLRVRLLVASPFLPHREAAHGGGVYLRALLGAMAEQAEVALVSFATLEEVAARARPDGPFARVETLALPQVGDLRGVARARYRIRMLWRWGLQGLPLTVAKFRSPAMAATLARVAGEFRPDVCLVEFALMAQYLPALAGFPRVLTDHEAASPVPAQIGPGGMGRARDRALWGRYVARYYAQAEALRALNEADAAALREACGREVGVRPATAPLPERPVAPAEAPPRALFFGDYSHHPNPEAASFLARELWPRVRERLPTAELWFAGSRMPPEVEALGAEAGVSVRGFVPDLAELLGSVRCLLAPVFSGAGSRIKVLTALAHGLPVIANELGLRGVTAAEPAAVRAESVPEFVAALASWLAADATPVVEAGRAAREWAESTISPEAVARDELAWLSRGL